MQNLPNWAKCLLIAATLIGCAALLYYTNLRNGQAVMPLPDWFTSF